MGRCVPLHSGAAAVALDAVTFGGPARTGSTAARCDAYGCTYIHCNSTGEHRYRSDGLRWGYRGYYRRLGFRWNDERHRVFCWSLIALPVQKLQRMPGPSGRLIVGFIKLSRRKQFS
jgi:hypothetical protein